jgi:hypothetical protein
MRRLDAWSISACIVCFSASVHVAMADTLVISPGPETSTEGDSNNAFPFNLGTLSMRYQQVYTSSDFSAITGPSLVTAILFRPDATFGSAFSSTLPDVEISLSTTSKTPSTLDSIFAANVGGDDTVVYNGLLALSSAFNGPSMGPKAFDIVIDLLTPFLYDPSTGDLLLDVTNFGSGVTTQFDAVSSGDTHINRVWALDSGATSATVDATSAGLVTEFRFTSPVPEPSAFLLLGTCIALSAGAVRRRRR